MAGDEAWRAVEEGNGASLAIFAAIGKPRILKVWKILRPCPPVGAQARYHGGLAPATLTGSPLPPSRESRLPAMV